MNASPDDQDAVPPTRKARGRPRSVTAAVVMLIASAVVWLPIAGLLTAAAQGPTALLLIIYIVFVVLAARGRPTARTGISVTAVLLLFFLAPYMLLGFSDQDNAYGAADAVVDMVATAACCAGVALLYLPHSNVYFRARQR